MRAFLHLSALLLFLPTQAGATTLKPIRSQLQNLGFSDQQINMIVKPVERAIRKAPEASVGAGADFSQNWSLWAGVKKNDWGYSHIVQVDPQTKTAEVWTPANIFQRLWSGQSTHRQLYVLEPNSHTMAVRSISAAQSRAMQLDGQLLKDPKQRSHFLKNLGRCKQLVNKVGKTVWRSWWPGARRKQRQDFR